MTGSTTRRRAKIKFVPRDRRAVQRSATKVAVGGEFDFPPSLARQFEDLWACDNYEGTELIGFRLIREQV